MKPLAALLLLVLAFTVPSGVGAQETPPDPEEGLEEFEPSEEVPADETISFPVDI